MNTQSTKHSKGSHHWRWQRITAVGLIPLTMWFLFSIVQHTGDDHDTISNWIAQPYVAVLLVIYIIIMFLHSQLGMQEVIEDYVHQVRLKKICSVMNQLVLIAAGLIAVISVIRVAI